MKNYNLLKVLLVLQTIGLLVYTALAFKQEGADLLSVFIANIQQVGWNGQFNLDFSCYLSLSAVWIMWRNKFSVSSVIIALVAMIIGIIVFAPYLLFLLVKENSDLKRVLIGDR